MLERPAPELSMTAIALPAPSALLLIDLQRAIDHPDWGVRNNPHAETRMQALLTRWRQRGWPVIHVRHDSLETGSHYRPGQPGHAFKAGFEPQADELIIAKHTNNAFVGTNLEQRLRRAGLHSLVVLGVITNNSIEATVRMAGNLGFRVQLPADGCFTFNRRDWNGVERSADEVHAMSLANLDGEYCSVTDCATLLAALGQ
ncbi:isochorismatase hydrolase [Pseudogulbenkiania sp. NH8B]|nr:isochorismatase hydrolase [Pseudogulbenkiania sp. NH8B]